MRGLTESTKATKRLAIQQWRLFGLWWFALIGCCVGCSNQCSNPVMNVAESQQSNSPTSDQLKLQSTSEPKLRVLLIGNSHSSYGNLTNQLEFALESLTGEDAYVKVFPAIAFLDEHATNQETLDCISSSHWTHIVLQGQKYSTSGTRTYSTRGAEDLAEFAAKHTDQVILYPEWGQAGNTEEGERVHKIYADLASRCPGAKLAPVGLAWDQILNKYPKLPLHSPDGNHASISGAYVTALVLASLITDRKSEGLTVPADVLISPTERLDIQRMIDSLNPMSQNGSDPSNAPSANPPNDQG